MCHVIVGFHVLRVDVSLDLGFHVVIGVGRLIVQQEGFLRQLHFATHTQFQVQSSFLLDVVVRLCLVIVNSICIPNSCIFHNAKTGLLRYRQVEIQLIHVFLSNISTLSWHLFNLLVLVTQVCMTSILSPTSDLV